MNEFRKNVTIKTFKTMDSDDWFMTLSTMLIGIGFGVFLVILLNTIIGEK
tara:strand:+ start:441 stop:590 length:150 start_codon:yes stop_codon:yes gene_type:complete